MVEYRLLRKVEAIAVHGQKIIPRCSLVLCGWQNNRRQWQPLLDLGSWPHLRPAPQRHPTLQPNRRNNPSRKPSKAGRVNKKIRIRQHVQLHRGVHLDNFRKVEGNVIHLLLRPLQITKTGPRSQTIRKNNLGASNVATTHKQVHKKLVHQQQQRVYKVER